MKCDVCGRELTHKIKSHGYTLCDKHYNQLRKYGKFLDKNPRTIFDKNEYHIHGKKTIIDLYDKNCEKIAEAIIDTEDLNKVKYIKWKLSGSGYAMNTPHKGGNRHMSRVILGDKYKEGFFVDHKNHNTLDNRKKNLRLVTKSQNQMNANYKGVTKTKNGLFKAHIKINQKSIYLGTYDDELEALFARWYAETLLFKEFQYDKKKKPKILKHRRKQIKEYVNEKVQRL